MRVSAATRGDQGSIIRTYCAIYFWFLVTLITAAAATGQENGDPSKPPEPRVIQLQTKDRFDLRAAYFPSPIGLEDTKISPGKDAITVLILHEWRGQASPYLELAEALRDAGCAVLVPEYRGHGNSRQYTDARGQKKQLNESRMTKRDVEKIVTMDLETMKGFLKEENNQELLNLNRLVVIGISEGAVLAGHWAQRDWRFPSVGRVKQGQDVKALIYVSPEKQIKGIGIDPTLTDDNLIRLPIMIIAGDGSPEAGETERIAKRVESIKKRNGRGTVTGFELMMPDTKLSGISLLKEIDIVIPAIVDFIVREVDVSDGQNPWVKRP